MKWKMIMSAGAMVAGFVVFAGMVTAQSTDPAESQGGKVKTHHEKVYTISDEAARTLKDVEEQAYEVTDHAGTVQAASRIEKVGQGFYASELQAMKEDLNAIGYKLQRLEALQQDEKSWERRTVARTTPLLKQVGATADEVIHYVDDNPQKLVFPEYQRMTLKLYNQSTALWKSLHESVRLASLRDRELRLRKDMAKGTE